MRISSVRRGVPVLLLVAAGLALTACGPDDSTASSTASSGSTDSAATSTAPDATGAPVPDGNTGAGATPTSAGSAPTQASGGQAVSGTSTPGCTTAHLKITADGFNSGAGSTMFQLVFQNTGSTTCALRGYPGVSFVKSDNTQMGKAASRTGGATPVVTLIPNAHAYADVRTVNGYGGYSNAQCDLETVPTLRVYPPNETESANIAWNRQECVGADVQNLQVGPVHSNS